MGVLLEKIGQLAIFLICAQTLLHFRAKESYEKYIKLLVSMMLLILLMEPVMELLGKGGKSDFLESVQVYESELMDILGNRQLETGEISEKLLQITQNRANESAAYARSQDVGEQAVSATAAEVHTSNSIKIESVERIEIEVEYGEDS